MKLREALKNLEMVERTAAMRGRAWRILGGALRSRYFLFSLSLYLVLLLIASSKVLSTYLENPKDMNKSDTLITIPEQAREPQKPANPKPAAIETEPAREVTTAAALENPGAMAQRLVVMTSQSAFARPRMPSFGQAISPASAFKVNPEIIVKISIAEQIRLEKVRSFQAPWNTEGKGRTTSAEFTVFKARYQDGDWNCNPDDVENLLLQIRRWSKNRIKASLHPEVLDVGTDELFTLHPPFVYLTGHKDFRFLDREVVNLRDYLIMGGCVWADSALAGRNSRFDKAFRREIGRVLPDRKFETIPDNHEIFNAFFDGISLPAGMNHYEEPAEMINIGGEIAVLDTLNGCGHFLESRLNSKGNIEWNAVRVSKPGEKPVRWRHVYGPHLGHAWAGIIYRNVNDETTRASFKFGINAVAHLLTRYQDKIKPLPIVLGATTAER